jgi:hypothetical protein
MEKIEAESRLKDGDGPLVEMKRPLDELRRSYRYYFIGWRNRMMRGDTYFGGLELPRDDMHKYLRAEIERLQKLLPSEEPTK